MHVCKVYLACSSSIPCLYTCICTLYASTYIHVIYMYVGMAVCLACIVDALSKLWEHCSQTREMEKLKDEMTTLKQQLVVEQAALRSRDTELACLQETVRRNIQQASFYPSMHAYMCTFTPLKTCPFVPPKSPAEN